MDMDICGEQRQKLINGLAQDQAKDDLTKIVKPYIIKAKSLKKELRKKRAIADYRQALACFLDDIWVTDVEKKRRYIAKLLKVSVKTVKRYVYNK